MIDVFDDALAELLNEPAPSPAFVRDLYLRLLIAFDEPSERVEIRTTTGSRWILVGGIAGAAGAAGAAYAAVRRRRGRVA